MGGYILRQEEDRVVLGAEAVDRLVQKGSSDAALLYLALARLNAAVTPQELQRRLHWSELRLDDAEQILRQMGLLERRAPEKAPESADETPAYTTQDVTETMEQDEPFRQLCRQTEEKLGKKLSTADLQKLLGLYDDRGLPADVIYLLINFCIARSEKRYGAGRRPTMRQIEKEGWFWARAGIFDQEQAAAYIKTCQQKEEQLGQYMQVLGLGRRAPVSSEERYIRAWMDQGFTPEAVALGYDKTVFYKKELNWRYLNGILRRWHENGWHTAEEVQQGEKRTKPQQKTDDSGKLDKYMKW